MVYTCTGIGANLITRTVPNLMGGTEQLQILQHILHNTSGPFTAQFVSYQNNNIISTPSFTATTVLHSKDIVCYSGGDSKTCKVMITGRILQQNVLLTSLCVGAKQGYCSLSVCVCVCVCVCLHCLFF